MMIEPILHQMYLHPIGDLVENQSMLHQGPYFRLQDLPNQSPRACGKVNQTRLRKARNLLLF